MLATARRSCSLLKVSLSEGFLSSSQSPHSFKAKLSHELGFLSFTSSAEPQKQLVNYCNLHNTPCSSLLTSVT